MSVLIKDMEMPEHCGYCRFRYDGICHALQKTQYATTDCPLVSVPVQPEIIQCKDCKHYEMASNEANGWCEVNECPFAPWDFCSLGERKEE